MVLKEFRLALPLAYGDSWREDAGLWSSKRSIVSTSSAASRSLLLIMSQAACWAGLQRRQPVAVAFSSYADEVFMLAVKRACTTQLKRKTFHLVIYATTPRHLKLVP